MNKFTKNSIAIFLNLSFTANQLFSQVQPPSAVQWVPFATGPQGQPGWWAGRGATNTNPENDYAALKQGQLKHFARKAIEELNARYTTTGGAGSELNQLLQGWKAAAPDPKDQELVAVGQLKWVANKLHNRLIALSAGATKPQWLTVATGDDQIANLGQLKTAFNFTTVNPLNTDTDGDGMPDVYEIANGSNPNVNDSKQVLTSGLTRLENYIKGLLGSVAGSLATVPPLTIDNEAPHQAVGAIKGSLAVGGDGSASYSVPIDIPKGTGGMEPKLSLGYSSNGGNGVIGMGWSLGGLQTITRGPATVAKDGFYDPVDFDSNDRFLLDGERLVCVAGTYGAAGSEYRTEMDSYGRITYDGPGWKLETKAGLIVMFGQDLNSRVDAPSKGTVSWGVNRVSDTLGNYYDVSYDRGNANASSDIINFRVADINYTGHINPKIAPYCNVHFTYVDRPDDSRTFTTHASYRSSSRLDTIKVSTNGSVNHSYKLSYKNSFQTGRSFLKKITKYADGKTDAAHTVPATEFTYDGLELGDALWGDLTDVNLPQLMTEDGKDKGITFLDFNGDGVSDFSNRRATDFDDHNPSPLRDGTFDLTPITAGNVYINNGSGNFSIKNGFCPPAELPLGVSYTDEYARQYNDNHHLVAQPIDIDGDGALDLMGSTHIKRTINVSGSGSIKGESLKNDYQFYTYTDGKWLVKAGWDLPFKLCNSSAGRRGGYRRDEHFQFTDLNSDGYPDLIIHTANNCFLTDSSGDIILGSNKGTAYLNKGKDGPGWTKVQGAALPKPLLEECRDVGRRLVDLNGDGSPELLQARYEDGVGLTNNISFLKYNNTSNPQKYEWKTAAAGTPYFKYNLPVGLVRSNDRPTSAMLMDVNGDGLVDIMNSYVKNDSNKTIDNTTILNRGSRSNSTDTDSWCRESKPTNWPDQANSYTFPYPLFHEAHIDGGISLVAHGFETADLNGDGLMDFFYSDFDNTYATAFPGTPSASPDRNLAIINTGNGWAKRRDWGNPGTLEMFNNSQDRDDGKRNLRLQDLNGDGFPDLIVGIREATSKTDASKGPKVRFNQCRPEVLTSVQDGLGPAGNGNVLTVSYRRLNDPTSSETFATATYQKDVRVTPLLIGQSSIIDSRLVVSKYSEPDGRGGERRRAQRYGDLRYDRINEASLGFGWIEARDILNDQTNRVEYSRVYPFAGSPTLNQTTVDVAGKHISPTDGTPGLSGIVPGIFAGPKCLSSETSTYADKTPTGKIRRPVQTGSVKTSFDLVGKVVAQTTTSQTFDDFGFVTSSTATALDGSTVTTISNFVHTIDANRWHLGRLASSSVTKSGNTASITKNAEFTYHSTTGLLLTETVEPGTSFASTKTYTHDAFGNVLTTTVTGTGCTARSTSATYGDAGRFMTSASNQLGHTLSYNYDFNLALLTSTTDIVGRPTTLSYDSFGTLRYTKLPDGTQIGESTGFATNASLPPAIAVHLWNPIVFFRAKQASGSPVSKAYFDSLGREVASETTILRNANNTGPARYAKVYSISHYDDLGRKVVTSQPFGEGDNPNFSRVHYDLLNRVLLVVHPDGAVDKTLELSTQILAATTTRPKAITTTYSRLQNRGGGILERWEDTHGRLIQSRDLSGQITRFFHNQEGRLLSVSIDDKALLTNTFDLLGNKQSVWEANSGTSTSVYNAFGEVQSSTNAKGQLTSFTYDTAGRPKTVTKPGIEGTFTTEYIEINTPAALANPKALGKPYLTTGAGYQETIIYDDLARPTSTCKTQFGESFTTVASYDVLSRPHAEADAGGLIVVHEYDPTYSFPTCLKMGPGKVSEGTTLWKAGTYDSKGRALSQTLALGVGVGTSYHPQTGQVLSIAASQNAGNPSFTGVPFQIKGYAWDTLGNLTQRTDVLTKRAETFEYDTLNRVTSATSFALAGGATTQLPPPATFAYDTNGNLKSKLGAALTYGNSDRLHAVTAASIKGATRAYNYDAAGYVTADSKRTYSWSSFGQIQTLDYLSAPSLQTLAGSQIFGPSRVQTDFEFDAGGNRARQTKTRIAADSSRQSEQTLYLGSYEREIHATRAVGGAPVITKTVHRHSLGGFATYTRIDTPTAALPVTQLAVILKDHLGSTDCLITGTWNGSNWGDLTTQRESFDTWGERRAPDSQVAYRQSDGDAFRTGPVTYERGYTGHEQLDDSGLIHMNGRLYDPELGRMLSPDPYVQVPEYSQNFNRYSYVLNNPLNLTDPTGFSFLGKLFGGGLWDWARENWRTVVVIVVAFALSLCTAGIGIALLGPALAGTTAFGVGSLAVSYGAIAAGAAIGAITGGLSAALNGGNMGDVLRGAVVGGISGAMTAGMHSVGGSLAGEAANVVGHGVIGGASNVALGGKFQDGFLSAAASAATAATGLTDPKTSQFNMAGRTAIASIAGGTASALGGGKFANGAVTGAMTHLLNAEAAPKLEKALLIGKDQSIDARNGDKTYLNPGDKLHDYMLEGIEDAAKAGGYKLFYNATKDTIDQVWGSKQFDEIIYYNHGTASGNLQYNKPNDAKPYFDSIRNIFNPSAGTAKNLTIICCHYPKVVDPSVTYYQTNGVNLKAMRYPLINGSLERPTAMQSLPSYLKK